MNLPKKVTIPVAFALVLIAGATVFVLNRGNPETPEPKESVVVAHEQEDRQREFDETYNSLPIQYRVEWSVKNAYNDTDIGPHIFTLNLYNTRNEKITIQDTSSIAVGCISEPIEHEPMVFGAYETKRVKLSIDVSCEQLGTADGKYFWDLR